MSIADKCRYLLQQAGVANPSGDYHFFATAATVTRWRSDNPIPQPTPAELTALDTDHTYIDWRLADARAHRSREMSDSLNAALLASIPEAVRWHVIAATLARIVRDAGITSVDPETQAMYDAMSASADSFGVTPSQAQAVVAAQVAARNRHVAAVAAVDAIIADPTLTLAQKLADIEAVTP